MIQNMMVIKEDYVVSDLNGKKIIGSFYEKELEKTSQKKLE